MKRQSKESKKDKLTQEDVKRYTAGFWKLLIGIIVAGFLFLLSVRVGVFGPLPSFEDLENPNSNLASEVITDDNRVLGTYYVHNRSNVKFSELSPALVHALIATEDKRFLSHSGIDYSRTISVIFHTLANNKQGGSTITQQLALNLFSEARERNFYKRVMQKFQEWITAVRLERNYTKEEIVMMYFNTVDFGAYNTFGIKSAARTYFNTTPDKLTVPQAAVLVAMLKGPSMYSPVRYPERATTRRNVVMHNMMEQGYLTRDEYEKYKQEPLKLDLNVSKYSDGIAPYFRAVLKEELRREFKRLSLTKSDGTPYDLDRDGLKIYTPINYRMQEYAEQAQKEWLSQLQRQFSNEYKRRNAFSGENAKILISGMKRSDRYRWLKSEGKSEAEIEKEFNTPTSMSLFSWNGNVDTTMTPMDSIRYTKLMLRNAMMAMEPKTGYIKAWVGGINFEHFKYDQVKLGTRQVGSTAKPFLYACAIDNGYAPCSPIPNHPSTYGTWSPGGPVQKDPITIKEAVKYSQNHASAYLINQMGASNVAAFTRKMGVNSDIPNNLSIALGSYDASVFDMVGAYSAFVNHGTWIEPTMILRVEDKNGTPIYEKAAKVVKVLNSQTAYAMVDILKGVVDGGTANRLRWDPDFGGLKNPIGGKTGTTNKNADSWFIGITPELVTGVWTGAEDRSISFSSTALGQGARSAMPVFGKFMRKVFADKELNYSQGDFPLPPEGITRFELNCANYSNFNGVSEEPPLQDDRLGF